MEHGSFGHWADAVARWGSWGTWLCIQIVLFELGAVTDSGTRAPSPLTAKGDTLLSQRNSYLQAD